MTVIPSIFCSQIRPSYHPPRLNPFSPSTRSLLTLPGCCVLLCIFAKTRVLLPPHVFVVGVLEQHQNHSFIVEPAAAAQTSIIHSRARRQQRQRKKNLKLHKRIRMVSTVSGSKTHSIQLNPCCIRHQQGERLFSLPTTAVQLLGRPASV